MSGEMVLQQSISGVLSDELAVLAARVRRGVVQVSDGRGAGAGTIWSADGIVVTNHHVVPGDRARVTLFDERILDARTIVNVPERDLAILKVDAGDLDALPAGDSTALRPGEIVLAVGNPLGVTGAVSLGIFSGVGPIEGGRGKHIREALLANIELRPGNSGGPLVNARGEVVGINAMVIGPGTALAVPSATVQRFLNAHQRRTLGVQVTVVQSAQSQLPDTAVDRELLLVVVDVVPSSAAERAGLLPGDVLLALAGHRLDEPGDIGWALAGAQAGEGLSIEISRGGERRELVAGLEAA
ncbi:MAG: S1C family serine protease [Vicinamibacterales bacterium]